MSQDHESHTVRRIVLPSGRSIEVVRFRATGERASPRALHLCPACGSDLVQPVSWCEGSQRRWELELQCPNCWWQERGLYERERVEALEDQLDFGLAEILGDLQRLTRANMADEIDRFACALRAGMILPEDF